MRNFETSEERFIRQLIDRMSINRVEVINNSVREYVNWEGGNKVTISIQDEGRTLKIFVENK